MVLPLQPTEVPGVYRRGSRFVVVYRAEGRQRKQSADTLAEARAIKLKRDGEARAKRRGPTLHEFSLSWLNRYAGTGHDSVWLPAAVEATAYFVVAESLTNVAKHARAKGAAVMARVEHGILRVQVRDDGVGGARPDGSGLLGLADRLAALDGRLRVKSPADGGTLVAADIPLPG